MTVQPVVPMISYADGAAAMDWLAAAFGFEERTRMMDGDLLSHGEMVTGPNGGLIMLATPTREYEGPAAHRAHCERAQAWSKVPWVVDGVLVHVDDVVGHLARARAAGATILSEVQEDFPGPRYRAEDLEGHRWMFLQPSAD